MRGLDLSLTVNCEGPRPWPPAWQRFAPEGVALQAARFEHLPKKRSERGHAWRRSHRQRLSGGGLGVPGAAWKRRAPKWKRALAPGGRSPPCLCRPEANRPVPRLCWS